MKLFRCTSALLVSMALVLGASPAAAFATDLTVEPQGRMQTQAAKKPFTIKKYKSAKKYGVITVKYTFGKPILNGKSSVAKRINKSLEARYKKSVKAKNTVINAAKKRSAEQYASTFFYTTDTKVAYKKGKTLTVKYEIVKYSGGTRGIFISEKTIYSLKTGKVLKTAKKRTA